MLSAPKVSAEQKGLFFTFVSAALIATAPLLNKFGLVNIHPFHAATLWCLFSALFTLTTIKLNTIKLSRQTLFQLIRISSASSLGVVLLFCGVSLLDPSSVAFVNRSYTLFIILLGIYVLKEPTTPNQKFLFAIHFLGLLLFSYRGLHYEKYYAFAFVVLSALSFAFANMRAKILVKNLSPNLINFYSHSFSFLLLLPGWILLPKPSYNGVEYILVSAFCAGFLGMLFYLKGLQFSSFTASGIARAFSPVLTTLYAIPFFGITYNTVNIMGMVLILLSSFYLLIPRSKQQ